MAKPEEKPTPAPKKAPEKPAYSRSLQVAGPGSWSISGDFIPSDETIELFFWEDGSVTWKKER